MHALNKLARSSAQRVVRNLADASIALLRGRSRHALEPPGQVLTASARIDFSQPLYARTARLRHALGRPRE
ncbi:hypothetical protein, partial [Verminephrobacter aporrectodeae]|uniref:hypothetical protein n=1 Tax=Verminephrobacter aporrectodeae TaxID=1110389 RepID=UPI0002376C1E